ncbi:MAG: lysophospholipid acyltransferase family protein [Bacteroidales bacterium]|nr:lysophospholipid acyltransferase family protein [Bacteroidales bacterium]MCF8456668.1 lysophospholipid acyltransferase family protein [Bacteroidales bacterium]
MDAVVFYLVYSIVWGITLLPMPILYLISDIIFFLNYYVIGYRKKVVFENLQRSFPEKSVEELKIIRRKFYRHFADIIIEIAATVHLSEKDMKRHCTFKNVEVLDRLYQKGKSVTAIMGHYGNWEWQSGIGRMTQFRAIAIYKPLSNPYFDRFMTNMRQKFGLEVSPMNRIYRDLSEAKKAGQQTLTFFIADQSPMRRDIKLWIDFMNQKTGVFLGADKISKKLNNAIVYFKMKKIKRGRYEVEIIPLFEELISVEENEITISHMKILEEMIREQPEHWLWSHRRWKHQPE